jgi:hypothetical protein
MGDFAFPKGTIRPLELGAVYDEIIHGLIAVSLIWPIEETRVLPRKLLLPLAFLLGGVIDVDHIVAAKSFSVHTMFRLPMRPPLTHNLLLPALMLVLFWVMGRRFLSGWMIFLALASHVLRDASDGQVYLFVTDSITRLPIWLFVLGEFALLTASVWSLDWAVVRGAARQPGDGVPEHLVKPGVAGVLAPEGATPGPPHRRRSGEERQ